MKKADKIHKILKNFLNETMIKECPLKCGTTNIRYESLVGTHLLKECTKIKVKCNHEKCNAEFVRSNA